MAIAIQNCSTSLNNLLRTCEDCLEVGGLFEELYIASIYEVDEISSTTNNKVMDTITMKINPITSQPYFWYAFAFTTETAMMMDELQVGATRNYMQTVTFNYSGLSEQTLSVLEGISCSEVVIIGKDRKKNLFIAGRLGGLRNTVNTSNTGAAGADAKGGTVTFAGAQEEKLNRVLSGTQIQVWNGTAPVTVTL